MSGYATFADACPACVTLWTVALMHRMRCYRHWVADSFSTFQPLKTVPRPWGFFFYKLKHIHENIINKQCVKTCLWCLLLLYVQCVAIYISTMYQVAFRGRALHIPAEGADRPLGRIQQVSLLLSQPVISSASKRSWFSSSSFHWPRGTGKAAHTQWAVLAGQQGSILH